MKLWTISQVKKQSDLLQGCLTEPSLTTCNYCSGFGFVVWVSSRIIIGLLFHKTHVFLENLTPTSNNTLSISQCHKELLTSYIWLANVNSHYQLVPTCLCNNNIPWGLQINIHFGVLNSPCGELSACFMISLPIFSSFWLHWGVSAVVVLDILHL